MTRNRAIATTTSLLIAIFIAVIAVLAATHSAPRHNAGDSPWDGPGSPAPPISQSL